MAVGFFVGSLVGMAVGFFVGSLVGMAVGFFVGIGVGLLVGGVVDGRALTVGKALGSELGCKMMGIPIST
jgi:hypothetical protein